MAFYLWKISQNKNNDYDTYSDAVVIARNEEEAKSLHPDGIYVYKFLLEEGWYHGDHKWSAHDWVDFKDVKCERIGIADAQFEKPDVIIASFHAG